MLKTERYVDQARRWPANGRHILAQWDTNSIFVYQAYRPSIAHYAVRHGRFGGEFSYARMSWIKPNFLWMMYRSGWGAKEGQEITLALRIGRVFFDRLLAEAVESSYSSEGYPTREDWETALAHSGVRLQWDPDHHPTGTPLPRRALQLGLRDAVLEAFGRQELLEVINLSEFVEEQRVNAKAERLSHLLTPVEQVYVPADQFTRRRLRLDEAPR